jgi:hypothetical protein
VASLRGPIVTVSSLAGQWFAEMQTMLRAQIPLNRCPWGGMGAWKRSGAVISDDTAPTNKGRVEAGRPEIARCRPVVLARFIGLSGILEPRHHSGRGTSC